MATVKAARAAKRAARLAVQRDLDVYNVPAFEPFLKANGQTLKRKPVHTMGLNIGLYCNLNCNHCHVEAGPQRKEYMCRDVADRAIHVARNTPSIEVIDLTGGAPELNPMFRHLTVEARKYGFSVTDRCNLTCLWEPGQEDLPEFLAEHKVRVVASLPCYSAENLESQRGTGVFAKSIKALQRLNDVGYGIKDDLPLDLVYNPAGAFLAPPSSKLEPKYKEELRTNFEIEFTNLHCLNNMPVKRYADYLYKRGKLEEYLRLLVDNFNDKTVEDLMCQDFVNIRYDGVIYDCDFNQQLDLPMGKRTQTLFDIESLDELASDEFNTGIHCYGCTAGSGSR